MSGATAFGSTDLAKLEALVVKIEMYRKLDDRPLASQPTGHVQSQSLKVTAREVAGARRQLLIEASQRGDFSCHQSAYDADMNVKPYREHRQCPGAAKVYVAFGEKLYREKK